MFGWGWEVREKSKHYSQTRIMPDFLESSVEESRAYFKRFSERSLKGLSHCGFPLCKGSDGDFSEMVSELGGMENKDDPMDRVAFG
jgi:hypothetical protein